MSISASWITIIFAVWLHISESVEPTMLRFRSTVVFSKCGKGPTSNRYESEWILRGLLGACGGDQLSSEEINSVSTEQRSRRARSRNTGVLRDSSLSPATSMPEMHLTCVEALLRSMRNNDTLTVRKFTSPGTVFFVQLDAKDPKQWYMKELLDWFGVFGVNTSSLILGHLSDNSFPPHDAALWNFYSEWGRVLRNYWWNEAEMQRLAAQGHVLWFPLGYSHHVAKEKLKISSILHTNSRNMSLFFLGNKRSGNLKRLKHVAELRRRSALPVSGEVRAGGTFGSGSRSAYIGGMLSHAFCLMLPGRFPECYRMYDALELGCIPVIIDSYKEPMTNYSSLFSTSLEPLRSVRWVDSTGSRTSRLPLLRFPGVDAMNEGLQALILTPSALNATATDCALWWEAVKAHYKTQAVSVVCRRSQISATL